MTTTGLPQLVERWAHLYEDQKVVSAAVIWAHLAGVVLGGGAAVAADREALMIRPGEPIASDIARWQGMHRWVLAGLLLTLISGLLMLFADLRTFLPSVLYWTKMTLVVLLLINGDARVRAERTLAADGSASRLMLRRTSAISLVLWFGILLAGAMLTTI